MRLGTDHAENYLVNVVARTIEVDDGHEEGMSLEGEIRQPQIELSDRIRKRRRSADETDRIADTVS